MRYEILKDDLKECIGSLSNALKLIEQKLTKDSSVSMNYCGSGKHQYYYLVDSSTGKKTYCKADSKSLERAAQLDYFRRIKKIVEKQLKMENKLFEFLNDSPAELLFNKLSDKRQKLVSPLWLPDDVYAQRWVSQKYETNPIPIKGDNYSLNGTRVRSKTEMLIADRIYNHNVPFIYEKQIKLANGKSRYPDFTILNKRTHKEYIWEHLGLMDNDEYRKAALNKINEYRKVGFVLGVNLIITYEEEGVPFDSSIVNYYIKNLFM